MCVISHHNDVDEDRPSPALRSRPSFDGEGQCVFPNSGEPPRFRSVSLLLRLGVASAIVSLAHRRCLCTLIGKQGKSTAYNLCADCATMGRIPTLVRSKRTRWKHALAVEVSHPFRDLELPIQTPHRTCSIPCKYLSGPFAGIRRFVSPWHG